MRGKQTRTAESTLRNIDRKMRKRRPRAHGRSNSCPTVKRVKKRGRSLPGMTTMIGWPDEKDHFAQTSLTIGYTWEETLRLSNLLPSYDRKSGVTMRGVLLTTFTELTTLRRKYASHPGLSPSLSPEPRHCAPSSC